MIVYPGASLGAVGQSNQIVPFNTTGIQIGQLSANAQPIRALGLVCTVSPGASLTYGVQITGDNPNKVVNWNDHDTLVLLTASAYGQIIYPISALRLVVSIWASGTVNLGVVQWP